MMPNRSTLWMKYFFVAGAVIDGAAAVMLVSPALVGAFFGRPVHPADADLHLMMGYAASLVAGWTALLAWAAFDPVRLVPTLALQLLGAGVWLALYHGVRRGTAGSICASSTAH